MQRRTGAFASESSKGHLPICDKCRLMRPEQAKKWLSEPRFRNFQNAVPAQDHDSAVALYLWNAEVSAAFLGVLHHVPDTAAGLAQCVRKLKRRAPFLLYLYYSLDNRPAWFRGLWKATDMVRRGISRTPFPVRKGVTQLIALTVYWPLARTAKVVERLGRNVSNFPLSTYRDTSFYTMRTDALDRFGTRLEHRFSKAQIAEMMRAAGLTDVVFSDHAPFWVACGLKA